jgi:hypothetical protein
MPAPPTPSLSDKLDTLIIEVQAQTAQIASLEATVAAQAEDMVRLSNFARLQYEAIFGAGLPSSGIWDGTDRFP